MSHFSEIKTNLKSKTALQKALKQLGYTIEEEKEGVAVRGFFGETQEAEFKILTSTHYDIGFKMGEDRNYELVGDWELLPKVSGIEQGDFMTRVKREYAKSAILELAEARGYDVDLSENAEEESIEMVVTKW